MGFRSWSRRLGALCAVLALSGTGLAQAPAGGPEADDGSTGAEAQADALIRAGVALRREGKEQEALARFREAYRMHASARALGQMGLAAKSLRLYVEAVRYLEGALASPSDPWVAKNLEALKAAHEVVSKHVASLMVTTNANSGTLLVNGAKLAELPLQAPVRVLAGAAQIEVRAEGFEPASARRTLLAGQVTTMELTLSANDDATPAPPTPAPLAPAPTDPAPERESSGATQRTLAGVAAGVGVLGVVTGAYFGLKTLEKKSERDEVCPDPRCADPRGVQLDEDARSAATWSTVGFIVGAAGLGAAATLWFTAPTDSQSGPSVALRLGPRTDLRVTF